MRQETVIQIQDLTIGYENKIIISGINLQSQISQSIFKISSTVMEEC